MTNLPTYTIPALLVAGAFLGLGTLAWLRGQDGLYAALCLTAALAATTIITPLPEALWRAQRLAIGLLPGLFVSYALSQHAGPHGRPFRLHPSTLILLHAPGLGLGLLSAGPGYHNPFIHSLLLANIALGYTEWVILCRPLIALAGLPFLALLAADIAGIPQDHTFLLLCGLSLILTLLPAPASLTLHLPRRRQ